MKTKVETRVRYIHKDDSNCNVYTFDGDEWLEPTPDGAANYPYMMERCIAWVESRVVVETEWVQEEDLPPLIKTYCPLGGSHYIEDPEQNELAQKSIHHFPVWHPVKHPTDCKIEMDHVHWVAPDYTMWVHSPDWTPVSPTSPPDRQVVDYTTCEGVCKYGVVERAGRHHHYESVFNKPYKG